MRGLVALGAAVGVFFPHLWSLFVVARGLLALKGSVFARLTLEPFVLPLAMASFRLIENLFTNPVFAWAEFVYLLLVALALWLITLSANSGDAFHLQIGLFVGGLLFMAFALVNFWDQIYWFKSWNVYPNEVRMLGRDTFVALSKNAIISRDLGYIGPGNLRISIKLRHKDPSGRTLEIPLSLVREGSPNQPDILCSVGAEWSACDLTQSLQTRARMFLWLGGWDRWSVENSAVLEVTDLRIVYLSRFPVGAAVKESGRTAGLTFNPNAMGLTALVGFLLVILIPGQPALRSAMFAWPFVIIIVMTGSRACLGGLLIFGLMLLLGTKPWARLMGYLLPFGIIAVLAIGFGFLPEGGSGLPRILNPFAELYEESRVYLYVELISQIGFSLLGRQDFQAFLSMLHQTNPAIPMEHAHSLWLQVYGASGLVGLAILGLAFSRVERRLHRVKWRTAWATFFALYFVSFFDYFAFFPPYYILLFGLSMLPFRVDSSNHAYERP
ncbi:MAG: O-antigen ligase family protein [Meiothermus sp.]|uniref:O-antigen ligase family protein n=1 Tax=Meiothermus sp. TaxID=1955249 RepID=UPI0025F9B18C|nr:O-antigen ligase family protein [Meiothermus sp.]MCS7068716.1 O-antigen ligase family protein [Meiothermus sp.]MDW8424904.1 O-antigen ligase family protein [Meiothermus sp.]